MRLSEWPKCAARGFLYAEVQQSFNQNARREMYQNVREFGAAVSTNVPSLFSSLGIGEVEQPSHVGTHKLLTRGGPRHQVCQTRMSDGDVLSSH
jgi:hypothetical protein